jgi:hypothetical protein
MRASLGLRRGSVLRSVLFLAAVAITTGPLNAAQSPPSVYRVEFIGQDTNGGLHAFCVNQACFSNCCYF